ncbi:hypothetical protein [Vibrio anguillarum]|uniref:Uncharacterized protein n=1 Tax=Vibrio anguillarum TaxID=55601 RepID=A0ABR9Z824_VIBAN|nr:hypothetical protein [Vibrio anguillarum]MBF4374427.1 hypothetical protein [Vibrio anguillarum]
MKSNDYQPIWYQRNRPFAKFSKQSLSQYGSTGKALQEIQERIVREWNSAIDLKKVDTNNICIDLMPETSLAFYYGAFAAHGYNLFSFTEQVGEMLAHTKADEVPISALKSPYPVYFVQFHKSILWGGLEITGAYVIDDDAIPALQICLVLNPLDPSAHWMSSPCGYFYLPLPKHSELGLGALIQHTIDNEIVGKWAVATSSMPIENYSSIDVREQRARRETMDLSSGRAAIQEAMEYLANCLCYLSSHQRFKQNYPFDAPSALTDKAMSSQTMRQKQKAQSQLGSMGYHLITYIRLESDIAGGKSSAVNVPSGKKQHWRRGHWRNQRKGVELSECSLIWIRPTLVGDIKHDDSLREYRLS